MKSKKQDLPDLDIKDHDTFVQTLIVFSVLSVAGGLALGLPAMILSNVIWAGVTYVLYRKVDWK